MNITVLVNRDLPALLALNYLLPQLKDHRITVFYTRKKSRNDLPLLLQQLSSLENKTYFDLEQSDGTQGLLNFEQLRQYTCADITQLNAANTSDYPELRRSQPELIVSIRHMTILKETVIGLPERGVINLHSGLLPAYQGVMSTFRAMTNNEPMLGSTLHRIEDHRIDNGAIIAQSKVAITPNKSYLWNVLNLYRGGCNLIINAIGSLASGQVLQSIPQKGDASYYSYPNEQELFNFKEQGFELFDADDVHDFNSH